jgi:ABC-type branched-subunit amino acid transport system ATPase component
MQIDGSGAKAPNRELVVAVDRVSLQFGGVQAQSEVSLCLVQGEWLALAGPNGSGKSSLLNCISGAYIATGGRINIGGKEVTRKSPAIRGRLGVARTFQTPRLAAGLSIAENVWLGGATRSVVGDRLRRGEAVWTAVHEALEEWDIERYADNLPANVPYGARKQAELARLSVKASTASSQLFLMDEPAAGLSPEEREELVTGLRSFRLKHADAAVIIVEHDVQLLGQLCDSAVALDYGKVVTHGTFADVFASDTVVLSFIGREDAE